jgi:hypothetical protein
MTNTESSLSAHPMPRAVAPHPLHISQQLHKKRMSAKRGRIAHQQQLAPCAGHADVHAADVRQEADVFNLTVVEYLPYKRMDFFMA